MEIILSLLLFLLNSGFVVGYFMRFKEQNYWLWPATYFLLNGYIQYPIRAVVLLIIPTQNVYNISNNEILLSLLYYTAFIFVFIVIVNKIETKKIDVFKYFNKPEGISTGLIACFILVVGSFYYKFANGQLYGLYEDKSDLYLSAGDNLFTSLWSVRWLFLPWALLEYKNKPNKIVLIMVLVVVAASIVEAIASTGKGAILYFVVLFLFTKQVINERISKRIVILFVLSGLIFSVYSYIARYYGSVRGASSVQSIAESISAVKDNVSVGTEMATGSIMSRFSYLDGLALTIRRLPEIKKKEYCLGSIVEIENLLPRSLWSSRPFLSFNHFMTSTVWGVDSFLEMPIGRIGESFFVLGWIGVIYAVFYGLLFDIVARSQIILVKKFGSIGLGLYFFLLISYFFPDAYLLYNVKMIIFLLPWIAIVWILDGPHRNRAISG